MAFILYDLTYIWTCQLLPIGVLFVVRLDMAEWTRRSSGQWLVCPTPSIGILFISPLSGQGWSDLGC